jgi:hypothetical protein
MKKSRISSFCLNRFIYNIVDDEIMPCEERGIGSVWLIVSCLCFLSQDLTHVPFPKISCLLILRPLQQLMTRT